MNIRSILEMYQEKLPCPGRGLVLIQEKKAKENQGLYRGRETGRIHDENRKRDAFCTFAILGMASGGAYAIRPYSDGRKIIAPKPCYLVGSEKRAAFRTCYLVGSTKRAAFGTCYLVGSAKRAAFRTSILVGGAKRAAFESSI